jgi:hypothetical protein
MQRLACLAALAAAPFLVFACSSGDSGSGGSQSDGGGGSGGKTSVQSNSGGSGETATTDEGGGGSGGDVGSGGAGGSGGASDACSVDGNPGVCIETETCAMMSDHTSTAGHCAGPADVECCTKTPNVADNPPIPAGYELMMQSQVTPEMTTWAVMILDDPTDYPIFSTAMKTFEALNVLARVEWHPPDFQNGVVHRGVTLYEPE